MSFVDYMRGKQNLISIQYDLNTITAQDYTVEFDITPEQYEIFCKFFLDNTNPISEIGQFKLYIKREFLSILSKIYSS